MRRIETRTKMASFSITLATCAALVATASCSSSEDPSETAASAESQLLTSPPEELEPGLVFATLLRESLDDVELRPDQQKALQELRADVEQQLAPVREARRALSTVVADGVAAGELDDAKLDVAMSELKAALTVAVPAIQGGADRLHATLDSSQRRTLVLGMRRRGLALREMVNDLGGPRTLMHARMGRLADELGVSAEQRKMIRSNVETKLGDPRDRQEKLDAHRRRMREIARAFVGENFDARKLGMARELPRLATQTAEKRLQFVETAVSELTPAQRQKLAQRIRVKAEVMGATRQGETR
jgi:hypothetical protein